MNYRKIGKTGIGVSEISLGCWTLGGLNWVNGVPNGWADVDEKEAIEAVNFAIEKGVNHFDNADVYGNGKAERLLAKALGANNKKVIIASKVGWFPGTAENAYEPQHIRHQCEQSLINLKRDYLDIYYFHHGDFGENDKYLPDALDVFLKLKKEGKIRAIGLSAYSADDFLRLIPKIKPDCIQSWANILDDQFIRKDSPVYKIVKENSISFVAFSPLAQGLLLGKYTAKNPPSFQQGDHRQNDKRFSKEELEKLEPKIEKLKQKFGSEIKILAGVALNYVLSSDIVACAIPGFRNKRQVELNLSGAEKKLTEDEIKFIRSIFYEG
jgi:aryl-alcohol dehydrogenase-like predicted oxidoreductase